MPFEDLGEDRQDTVLSALQAGAIGEIDGGADLFELVRRHVLEGVFCEPNYGGNRDLVGWALVGFPGQRYGYPDPYIDRVIDLPPIAVEGPPRRGDA
jgi:gluconate 2-dehydrogenase gamma chain